MFQVNSQAEKLSDEQMLSRRVLPLHPADVLLSAAPYQRLLQKLKQLIDLPDELYQAVYVDLIHRFADYVQILSPVSGELGSGFLNRGLRRGFEMCRLAVEAEHAEAHLLPYVCFSAGLLMELSLLPRRYRIFVTSEKGTFMHEWNPLMGPMRELGVTHYRVQPVFNSFLGAGPSLAVLQAQCVMPASGYDWITQNRELAAEWFALLADPDNARGVIAEIFKKFLQLFPNFPEFTDLPGFNSPYDLPIDTELADKFLDWLQERLDHGDLSINEDESAVHLTRAGVYLDFMQLGQEFAEKHGGLINVTPIYNQFKQRFGFRTVLGSLGAMVFRLAGRTVGAMQGFRGIGHAASHQVNTEGVMVSKDLLNLPTDALSQHMPTLDASKNSPSVPSKAGSAASFVYQPTSDRRH